MKHSSSNKKVEVAEARGFYHQRVNQSAALGHPHFRFPRYMLWSHKSETDCITIRIAAGLGSLSGFPAEKDPLKSHKWSRETLDRIAHGSGRYLASAFDDLQYIDGIIGEALDGAEDEPGMDRDFLLEDGAYWFANEDCLHDACYARTTSDGSLSHLMEKMRKNNPTTVCVFDRAHPFRLIDNSQKLPLVIPLWSKFDDEYKHRALNICVPGDSTVLLCGERVIAAQFPFGAGFFEGGIAEVGTDQAIDALRRIASSTPFRLPGKDIILPTIDII